MEKLLGSLLLVDGSNCLLHLKLVFFRQLTKLVVEIEAAYRIKALFSCLIVLVYWILISAQKLQLVTRLVIVPWRQFLDTLLLIDHTDLEQLLHLLLDS